MGIEMVLCGCSYEATARDAVPRYHLVGDTRSSGYCIREIVRSYLERDMMVLERYISIISSPLSPLTTLTTHHPPHPCRRAAGVAHATATPPNRYHLKKCSSTPQHEARNPIVGGAPPKATMAGAWWCNRDDFC